MLSKLAKKIMSSNGNSWSLSNQNSYTGVDGSICTNTINFDGFVFGNFKCPIEGFHYSAVSCCGFKSNEYCCTPFQFESTAKSLKQVDIYTDGKNHFQHTLQRVQTYFISIAASVFISILLVFCIFGAIIFFFIFAKQTKTTTSMQTKLCNSNRAANYCV